MSFETRSTKTNAICNANFSYDTKSKRDPCATCPLIPACHKQTGAGIEAFNRWISGINDLAERVS